MAKAFLTAYGFGKDATGGREGKVIFVDRLTDPTLDSGTVATFEAAGAGSLRWALTRNYDRIIIPIVSGWVDLSTRIDVFASMSDMTFLGQFAPSKGIGIRYRSLRFSGASNFILRYFRIRKGTDGNVDDALQAINTATNFIIDHCSVTAGWDETLSAYTSANANFTIQNCIIAEGCNEPAPEGGENGGERHAFGSLFGGTNCSWFRNIMAHFLIRNPSISDNTVLADIRNSVFYNWISRPTDGGKFATVNMVNNYYKPGPGTTATDVFCRPQKNSGDPDSYGSYYWSGNVLTTNSSVLSNQRLGVKLDSTSDTTAYIDQVDNETEHTIPVGLYESAVTSANDAYTSVLNSAGVSLDRDSVDERIVAEIIGGTATFVAGMQHAGIINTPDDVGGWPVLPEETLTDLGTSGDGIPDSWKTENGLDVNVDYGVAGTFSGSAFLYDTDTESPTYQYRWVEIYSMHLSGEIDPITPPTEYTLAVTATTGGTVNTSGGNFEASDVIELIATANEGYNFTGWRTIPTNEIISTANPYNYIMPASNASLQAVFTLIAPPVSTGSRFFARNPT